MASDSPDSRTDVVLLRDVAERDLPLLFEYQCDPVACRMAAFPSRGREAFMAHWKANILGVEAVVKKAVLVGDQVAGYVVCFEQSDRWLVGYWLGRQWWGRGIATKALVKFLARVRHRPLEAIVARSNVGSVRVLEKCGFTLSREQRVPDLVSGGTIEELVYTLSA